MKRSNLLLLGIFLMTGSLFAQDKIELKVEIVVDAENGWPTRIVVSGNNDRPTAWLGVSLNPYGTNDPILGGRHSSLELKQGSFRHEIQVDIQLLGGSFEFAFWGKKVDKVDCREDYCYWCKKTASTSMRVWRTKPGF